MAEYTPSSPPYSSPTTQSPTTTSLDPNLVLTRMRELAAADYGRTLTDLSLLQAEVTQLRSQIKEITKSIITIDNSSEDKMTLAIKLLQERLSELGWAG